MISGTLIGFNHRAAMQMDLYMEGKIFWSLMRFETDMEQHEFGQELDEMLEEAL